MTPFRSGPWADDVGFKQHVGGLVHWALWPLRRAQGSHSTSAAELCGPCAGICVSSLLLFVLGVEQPR